MALRDTLTICHIISDGFNTSMLHVILSGDNRPVITG